MTESEFNAKHLSGAQLDKKVCENIALVHSIVKRFLGRGTEYDDLFQIGCIGLVNAIRRFNPDLGFAFSTYATALIMGEIRRFLRDDGIIKVSRHLKEISFKANTYIKIFTDKNGREPTLSELSTLSGIPTEEIASAFDAVRPPHSIYKENDNGQTIADTYSSESDIAEEAACRTLLKQILKGLPLREQKIIVYRYFKDKTQNETAHLLGISQVQVSRIEKKLLEKIRKEFLHDI